MQDLYHQQYESEGSSALLRQISGKRSCAGGEKSDRGPGSSVGRVDVPGLQGRHLGFRVQGGLSIRAASCSLHGFFSADRDAPKWTDGSLGASRAAALNPTPLNPEL